MKILLTILMLSLVGCGVGKSDKKMREEAEKSADQTPELSKKVSPTFEDSISIADNSEVYTADFVLPQMPEPQPKIKAQILDFDGEPLPNDLINGGVPSQGKTTRNDGLYDVVVSVDFVVKSQNLRGFSVQIEVPGYFNKDGKPLVMITRVNVGKELYFSRHRKDESPVKDYAVLKEDVFLHTTEDVSLLGLIHRVMNHEAGKNADAEADLVDVRGAWTIEGNTLSQKRNAVLTVTRPGAATIKTNGYKLMVVGGDWSQVSIDVGNCERFKKENQCDNNSTNNHKDLSIITLQAPKVDAQKVEVNGQLISSFDGDPGFDANSTNFRELCMRSLPDLEFIPKGRDVCTAKMGSFNGEDIDANIILEGSRWANIFMDQGEFRGNLQLKHTEQEYVIFDGNQNRCTDDTCVFDFDKEDVDLVDGIPVPSKSLKERINTLVQDNPPRFHSGNFVAKSIQERNASWNFLDPRWKKHVSGFEGVWNINFVREWANSQCEQQMRPVFESWIADGVHLPSTTELVSLNPDEAAKAGIQIPETTGIETFEISISKMYNLWGITDTTAQTSVEASEENGGFKISYEARRADGRPFTDNSLGEAEYDEHMVVLRGKALEALRPVVETLAVEGFPGGAGYKTAFVSAATDTDLQGTILEKLTGKPGLRGKNHIIDGFKPGKVSFRFYWKGPDGTPKSLPITKADGEQCSEEDIERGECYIEYNDQQAKIDINGPKFSFVYTKREIKAEYREPYIAHPAAQGEITIPKETPYPSWLSIVKLESEDVSSEDELGFNWDNGLSMKGVGRLPGRGGAQRGTNAANAIPSQGVAYWGLSTLNPSLSLAQTAFGLLQDAGGRFSNAAKEAGGKIASGTKEGVGKAAAIFGEISHGIARAKGKTTMTLSPIVFESLRNFFSSSMTEQDGRYAADYPRTLIKSPTNTSELISCSTVPGVSTSQFEKAVPFQPEYIDLAYWVQEMSRSDTDAPIQKEENFQHLVAKRGLHLATSKAAIEKNIGNLLSESPVFRNLKTECTNPELTQENGEVQSDDPSKRGRCWTDMDALFNINRTRHCSWKNPQANADCKVSYNEDWKPVRIYWYKNQANFINPYTKKCKEEIAASQNNFTKLIDSLSKDSKMIPFMSALAYFTPQRLADLESLALIVKELKNQYWTISDIPENLRLLLLTENLTKAIASLDNMFLASPSRVEVEKLISASEFGWNDISANNLKDINAQDVKNARNSWDSFPSGEEVEAIERYLKVISYSLRPVIKKHFCKWETKGDIRYYPSIEDIEKKGDFSNSLKPNFVSPSSFFAEGIETRESIPVQNGVVWEKVSGASKRLKISPVKTSALRDRIVLSEKSKALDGNRVQPDTQTISGCQGLGRITDSGILPTPRFMFETDCE